MAGKLHWTAKAEDDLTEIWLYVANDSVGSADAILDRIGAIAAMLAEHPDAGRRRNEIRPGFRYFPEKPWLLFYRVIEGGVEIVRVIDGRRDLNKLF